MSHSLWQDCADCTRNCVCCNAVCIPNQMAFRSIALFEHILVSFVLSWWNALNMVAHRSIPVSAAVSQEVYFQMVIMPLPGSRNVSGMPLQCIVYMLTIDKNLIIGHHSHPRSRVCLNLMHHSSEVLLIWCVVSSYIEYGSVVLFFDGKRELMSYCQSTWPNALKLAARGMSTSSQ